MFRFILFLSSLCMLAGCATYKLGMPEGPPFRSIFIPAVVNKTFSPQMQTLLSASLRENFASGKPITLAGSRNAADASLEITITEYQRRMASAQINDTGKPASFYLAMTAKGTLINNHTGEIYFKDRNFEQRIQSFGSDQLVERERQNLYLLARNLSREIHQGVTTTW